MDIGQNTSWYGSYWYSALSCKGNNVVVAANVDALVPPYGYYVAFLFSHDGGISWKIQGQGLASPTWDHDPHIRYIDQIDSLNIVAFGDSGLLVRTSDGGETWKTLTNPSTHLIKDISFSDPKHGILVAADIVHGTYVTSDGGDNWIPVAFTRPYGWQCRDYGNGRYRIFTYGSGVIYTTRDNWNTVDSTAPITSDWHYVYAYCAFSTSDTMFAYGNRFATYPYACIAKTTDEGQHWASVEDDTTSFKYSGHVQALSDIDRDTIIAGLGNSVNKALWSTDHGATWKIDTITSDSSLSDIYNSGVGFNSEGQVLISYVDGFMPCLLIGRHATARVIVPSSSLHLGLFPNPAATRLSITDSAPNHTLRVVDILGREVLLEAIPPSGSLELDVSLLSPGRYMISDGISTVPFVKE